MLRVSPGSGSIMARFVPSFAATVDEMVTAEFDIRRYQGLDDESELSPYRLCSALRDQVLTPALHGSRQDPELVAQCARALAEIWKIPEPDGAFYREAVKLRILDRLDAADRQHLLTLEPTLAGAVYRKSGGG